MRVFWGVWYSLLLKPVLNREQRSPVISDLARHHHNENSGSQHY